MVPCLVPGSGGGRSKLETATDARAGRYGRPACSRFWGSVRSARAATHSLSCILYHGGHYYTLFDLKAIMVGSPIQGDGSDGAADIDMDMPLDFERENNEGEEQEDVGEALAGGPGTTDSEDDVDIDEVPAQKFQVRQKVYARDDKASGVLYE